MAKTAAVTEAPARLAFFERYLSVWVGLCLLAGVVLGQPMPSAVRAIRGLEFG